MAYLMIWQKKVLNCRELRIKENRQYKFRAVVSGVSSFVGYPVYRTNVQNQTSVFFLLNICKSMRTFGTLLLAFNMYRDVKKECFPPARYFISEVL